MKDVDQNMLSEAYKRVYMEEDNISPEDAVGRYQKGEELLVMNVDGVEFVVSPDDEEGIVDDQGKLRFNGSDPDGAEASALEDEISTIKSLSSRETIRTQFDPNNPNASLDPSNPMHRMAKMGPEEFPEAVEDKSKDKDKDKDKEEQDYGNVNFEKDCGKKKEHWSVAHKRAKKYDGTKPPAPPVKKVEQVEEEEEKKPKDPQGKSFGNKGQLRSKMDVYQGGQKLGSAWDNLKTKWKAATERCGIGPGVTPPGDRERARKQLIIKKIKGH